MGKGANQFNQADEIRLQLIKSKLLPEFSEKAHSKAIYTSRSLSSFTSKSSSNSLMNSLKQKIIPSGKQNIEDEFQTNGVNISDEINLEFQEKAYDLFALIHFRKEVTRDSKLSFSEYSAGTVRTNKNIFKEINTPAAVE
ncbi:hypothetical protein RhiirA4_475785 [Rhizophagus irregularis]|uniref:Uncharacterized protein n=1 Tax=Rhizophagus irregularis TaxID=588596 RepID=A0A2I1HAM0_9GLOM|nr:hypothetical protein RhiirA4_475785 [Rhizophagus irregularis]